MIPYCVFALQRRSYRRGNKVSGFFCRSMLDRSFRKGGEKGGGQTLEDREDGGKGKFDYSHPSSPPKKNRCRPFPPFFRKKRGRRIFIGAKSREGRVPKKFNPSSSSSFQHYAARRRCYTRAALPLLILTTTTSKFKRSAHTAEPRSPQHHHHTLFSFACYLSKLFITRERKGGGCLFSPPR